MHDTLKKYILGTIVLCGLQSNSYGKIGMLHPYNITYSGVDYRRIPLDHMLTEILNMQDGIFIEVGAHDGLFQSNTKLLEDYYGWRGILIEPSEIVFNKLIHNRPLARCFNCALGTFEEHGTYAYGDFDGHAMSSLTGRLNRPKTCKVYMRSLQSILDECGVNHIHFFSLDTEGYELNILKGIDFNKTTFDYLLIEIYPHLYSDTVSFLDSKGYALVTCLSSYNLETNPFWDGTHNDYLFKRRV